MGRWNKSVNLGVKRETRKQNISVSVPRYMADELSKHPNASEVVTKILEENWERITTQTLEKQIELERERIMDIMRDALADVVLDVFEQVRVELKK